MELYEELLCQEAGKMLFQISGSTQIDYKEIVKIKSLQMLQKIKTIIKDDGLNDFECIEEIVCIFEEMGSTGGSRHDLG